MDRKASIQHYKDIQKKAGGMGHPIMDVWNAWARELMQERDWDESIGVYKLPSNDEWEEKANITFAANSLKARPLASHEIDYAVQIHKEGINFEGCIFPGGLEFNPGEFEVDINFRNVRFLEGAIFENCIFKFKSNFKSIKSYNAITFENSQFLSHANFQRFQTLNEYSTANFENTIFKRRLDFSFSIFEGSANFAICIFEGITDFEAAEFVGEADFNAIYSKISFNLMDTHFWFVPDFSSYNFDHLPFINGAKIEIPSDYDHNSMAHEYGIGIRVEINKLQALKAIAIQAHDHEKEVEFFAREMKCKACELANKYESFNEPNVFVVFANDLNRLPYWLYDKISSYGQSIIKPASVWLVLMLTMVVIYAKLNLDNFFASLYLSFLHSLPVLGLWRSENHKVIVEKLFGKAALGWDIIFIIHNFMASLIIFLLFQAIRNKFKIK